MSLLQLSKPSDEATLHEIFSGVVGVVLSDGGDGEGYIISPDYLVLAKEFDKWQRSGQWKPSPLFEGRQDSKGKVVFVESQEFLLFSEDRADLPTGWSPSIVVELGWIQE